MRSRRGARVIPLTLEEVRAAAPGELRFGAGGRGHRRPDRLARIAEPGDLFVAVGGGVATRRRTRRARCGRGARARRRPRCAAGARRAVRDRARRRRRHHRLRPARRRRRTSSPRSARPHARTVAAEAGTTTSSACRSRSAGSSEDTELCVPELGMRGLGQIAELCAVARPRIGVITSIAPGPPRAPRHGRERRAGEGGAARGAPGGRHGGRPGGRAAARAVPARRREHRRCGDGGDVRLLEFDAAAPRRRRRGRARDARGAVHGRAPGAEHAAPRSRPTARSACRSSARPRARARSRSRAGAARSASCPAAGCSSTTPGTRTRSRWGRRSRTSRARAGDRRRARRARRDGRARAGRAGVPPRGRRAAAAELGVDVVAVGERPRARVRRHAGRAAPTRRPRCSARCCGRATSCSSRPRAPRAWSGSRRRSRPEWSASSRRRSSRS